MYYTKISIQFTSEDITPYFIGSQIRGALGYALKKTVCINPTMQCEGCFAFENCLYAEWFEQKEGYHHYRLDIELGRSYYDFSLYLFEEATARLPYVISALNKMLTETGLGKERQKTRDYILSINDKPIQREPHIVLPKEWRVFWRMPEGYSSEVIVQTLTPLRIKQENRLVRDPSTLKLPTLLNSIYQREKILLGEARSKPPRPFIGEISDAIGRFKDLTRYSGRQKSHLKIGGLDTRFMITGIGAEEYRLLKLAELIGVGKQTVFGLGKIKVIDTI